MGISCPVVEGDDLLASGFSHPPESAKPWTWWHWMNGNVSKAGITADLESLKEVGIGGLYHFHVGQMPIEGNLKFLSPEWWDLMRFTAEEADRLGLQLGYHNCPGWSSSGGPWVKVEDSMQKLVWAATKTKGPARIEQSLPKPTLDAKRTRGFYRDVAVLALPDSKEPVPASCVVDLSSLMDSTGHLSWDVPAGNWVIYRFGHTTTGKQNHPAPVGGAGYEVDKMRKEAIASHFENYPARILANAGSARAAIRTFEIDSYEVGKQDWTPGFADEFKKRRGYDLLPWLPAWAGRVITSDDHTARFRRDMDQTIADLYAENYYGHFASLVRKQPGLQFTVEPYSGPFDTLAVGGRADVVMAEFWQKPATWGWSTVRPVASVAHTLGMKIVAGEALTGRPEFAQWRQDPYALKSSADKAFCMGINRFVLHTVAHQPWPDSVRPGMTMSWWGTHFGRTQTWWKQSPPWFSYITRCQFLLQQGRFVGDLLYLDQKDLVLPFGYNGDAISTEVFLRDLSFSDGKLTLPHGASYSVLVLPSSTSMQPAVARKLRALARAGATILGPKPTVSPSLENFPNADSEVQEIAAELWEGGKIPADLPPAGALERLGVKRDFDTDAPEILWIHRRIDDADLYFVSNQQEGERVIDCAFRVTGKQPELWDPATGEMRGAGTFQISDGMTRLPLKLDPSGSVFVVFRKPASVSKSTESPNWLEFTRVQDVRGAWVLGFDPKWGGPAAITFDKLEDWSQRPERGVRYYSGTAGYEKTFDLAKESARKPLWLDLGTVKNIAEVEVNGKSLGTLWKPPFRVEITPAIQPGSNRLVVKVTNLWPNRLIGDEQEPDDLEWGESGPWRHGDQTKVGKPLKKVPEWVDAGKPRPSSGRFTFTTWKFYEKDSPLLPSGLLGPVQILTTEARNP
jgi:hypothetical protein